MARVSVFFTVFRVFEYSIHNTVRFRLVAMSSFEEVGNVTFEIGTIGP
jgi:hypothetical protein